MKNIFEINSWDEESYLELGDGAKYSRATIKKKYQGDLVGSGLLEYVMAYHADGNASFIGVEHFEGAYKGRQGSAAFEHRGTFRDGVAASQFHVFEGSGMNDLAGLVGKGSYTAGHSMTVEFDLMFELV